MIDHEKLDVYKVSITFAAFSYDICKNLSGVDRHARDQLLRASQSIPLNIAEGNGKLPSHDRRRFFQIANGSARECGAILDILSACGVISKDYENQGKTYINRIIAMLTKLIFSLNEVREETESYTTNE